MFDTSHGFVLVRAFGRPGNSDSYFVALPPASNRVWFWFGDWKQEFLQSVPTSVKSIDTTPETTDKRHKFRQELYNVTQRHSETDNGNLRLFPLMYQAGLKLKYQQPKFASDHNDNDGTYRVTFPANTPGMKKREDLLTIYAPIEEMIKAHLDVVPMALHGHNIVLWQVLLHRNKVATVNAVDAYLLNIDYVTNLATFHVRFNDPVSINLDAFMTNSPELGSGYRALFTFTRDNTTQPNEKTTEIPPDVALSAVVAAARWFKSGTDIQRVHSLLIRAFEEGAIGARRDDLVRQIVKYSDDGAKSIIQRVLIEEKFRVEEAKLESDSKSTGAWSSFCQNTNDVITGDTIASIPDNADIVSLVPPESKLKGTCYRRSHLIQMMNNGIVYQWPRAALPEQDIMFHRVEPAYWVTHDSYKLVTQLQPLITEFQFKDLGVRRVGTAFGVSTMHGESQRIYELVPLKTRDTVLANRAFLSHITDRGKALQQAFQDYDNRRPLQTPLQTPPRPTNNNNNNNNGSDSKSMYPPPPRPQSRQLPTAGPAAASASSLSWSQSPAPAAAPAPAAPSRPTNQQPASNTSSNAPTPMDEDRSGGNACLIS
jgi:hypothetical protein